MNFSALPTRGLGASSRSLLPTGGLGIFAVVVAGYRKVIDLVVCVTRTVELTVER